MPLGRAVGLSSSDIVLDGDPTPLPQKEGMPPIFGRVYCGQMAGWIKMPLGRQVGLSQSDNVLAGDPAPPTQKGSRAPQVSAVSIVARLLDGSRCHMAWR